jgi:predicted amidohydrolase YtcJ
MKIFHNANIYAPGLPKASAVVVSHGRFLALGSDQEILDAFSLHAKAIDLEGKTLWPGLTDAHVHLRLLAESMAMVDCETASPQECLARVKQASDKIPSDVWVLGHGWNQNLWEHRFGTAQQLDAVCGDKPAYLTAKSLHAGWANSLALQLAGIDKQTPDPPGGTIQRDAYGQPTGILFEAGAMRLVESVIPKPSQSETVEKITALFPTLWAVGLTGLHEFDDFSCWLALGEIFQSGTTPLRICKYMPFDHLDTFIDAGLRTGFGDDRLYLGGVKLFSDGALGPQTAAMLSPFEGTQNSGALLLTEDEIFEIGTLAADHSISLAVHAIGDLANHIVLNAFERLRAYEADHDIPQRPHRIEHVQILDPPDLPRFAQLGVTASVQPIHAPSDMDMADRYLGERAKYAYAYRSILEAGAAYVLGSDAPVEPINPFFGLHAAVTRCRLNGEPGDEGWYPEQRFSLDEALAGFTQSPAAVTFRGSRLGKIAPGFYADFIILEEDPFNCDPHQLGSIKPLATYIDGECRFRSESYQLETI